MLSMTFQLSDIQSAFLDSFSFFFFSCLEVGFANEEGNLVVFTKLLYVQKKSSLLHFTLLSVS